MSYYKDHKHTQPPATPYTKGGNSKGYGAIVGTVAQNTEKPITGGSGDHLQFYVGLGDGTKYQVDVNTQSKTGTAIEVYIANETLQRTEGPDQVFGSPQYGTVDNAQLSYAALGLQNGNFDSIPYFRIDDQLDAALKTCEFISVYGQLFDDGGANGKGIHETHYTGKANQDGALALYSKDATGAPTRTWYFFKFQEDSIS